MKWRAISRSLGGTWPQMPSKFIKYATLAVDLEQTSAVILIQAF